MVTEVEAPVKEPPYVNGVALSGVRKAFGDVVALDGVDLRIAAGELVAVVGPSGCGKSTLLELVCGLATPDAGTVSAPPAALMPQRDGLLPWLSALDNAALALRVAGASRSAARAAAHGLFATFGLDGLRAGAAVGAERRDAPAGRVHPHAAGRAAAAVPGRAVRVAGRADARAGADVAGRGAGARAAHGAARHARRRGGGAAGRPRRAALAAAGTRRARRWTSRLPRPRARTDAAVVELRERALAALGVDR